MRASLANVEQAVHELLDGFDPASLSDADCRHVIARLGWIEKVCAAARVRTAASLRSRGDRNTAEAMGRATGASTAQARREIDAREQIEGCTATRESLDTGELSLDQAETIAKTALEVPDSEDDLVAFAKTNTLSALRDEARKRRLNAIDPDELHARQTAARRFRHWRDELGMVCFAGALPPITGIPFVNRLDAETDRVFRRANREGRREPNDAYAADAFAAMVAGPPVHGKHNRADLIIVVDLNAYRRGHTEPGEVCHVVGGGPIPIDVARAMEDDAFLKAVLHDGVAIHTIKHFGHRIPATLRTALQVGAPPEFDGERCDHCGGRLGLEIDHIDPVANGGATEVTNLTPRCRCSHRAKTERDRAAGLLFGNDPRPYQRGKHRRRRRAPP